MDLYKTIRELHEERKRLDAMISRLERIQARQAELPPPAALTKRRGRKNMPDEERKIVSERMRRYWAARRQERMAEPAVSQAGS
jgi:hypothetical protein